MNYTSRHLEERQSATNAVADFYKKTYLHLAGAVLAFAGLEFFLIKNVDPDMVFNLLGSSQYIWLAVIGVFWLVGMLANKLALAESKTVQYAGLGLYVVIEAIIFLPMLLIASSYADSTDMITQAGIITLSLFVGLTLVALNTKTDFSFLRTVTIVGGFIALGLIVAGAIFGFELGLWFSVGMIVLAAGSILYETQKLKEIYRPDQYVGASLTLFASIMLIFWYVLRILMSRRD